MQFIRSTGAIAALALALCSTAVFAHEPAPVTQTAAQPTDAALEALTGTVHEVIIDDTTRGTSRRYVELELADGSLVPLQGDEAQSLVRGSAVSVRGRRVGKALDVESSRVLAPTATPDTRALAEIDGTLAILHADDFVNGRSAVVYEVHHASGKIHQLLTTVTPSLLEPGMKVRVRGRIDADGTAMTPDRITILSRQASATDGTTQKAAIANRVLVIMANFNNTTTPAFTAAQAQQVMTSNSDSVANFFRETSYGQQLMNVTVTPSWVRMNLALPATCTATDWTAISTAADAAAKALSATYDPTTYNFVVYLFPNVPACWWSGLGYIGTPQHAWVNGTSAFTVTILSHEMGHNFGLLHASSLRCATAIGGTCTASEYGDPFDAMGNQRAMHYNAMQKAKIGWIPSTTVKTHTSGSATYTLSPLEVGGATTYAVKIPAASNRTYWVEFRQPIGFDAPLSAFPNNGVQIRVSAPFETMCSGCSSSSAETELLDMTPSTTAFTDATLLVGQTFRDPTYGINVTVTSATASAVTVQVGTGAAAPTATTTSITATPNPSMAGAQVTITAAVSGTSPTGTVAFTDNGSAITGCATVALAGSGNIRTATCITNALAAGSQPIVARYSGDAQNLASTSTALTQTVNASATGGNVNVALASNGGVASASSTYGAAYPASAVNDNARSGAGWGAGGGWNDATAGSFPDWVQINFNGQKTIDHVVVYTLQDNYATPVEPTDTMTFTRYGITAFQVQGWNGTAWVTLGSVSGNNLVKRTVTFAAFATDRIRIQVTGALASYSRITEVEAWTAASTTTSTNFALASNGGVASASSVYGAGYPVAAVNNGSRSGAGWGSGGGWNDATLSTFPDWVQINFSGQKTIDHVVVYTLQDNYASPVEPSDTLTFTRYGITAFQVQTFNGSAWVTIGSVSGNNLVKRAVSFTPTLTDRIRINVTGALSGYSRITEVEAWGN